MQHPLVLQFVCAPQVLNQVRGKLEKLQYNIKAADFEFIPKTQITLSDADLEAVRKLYDKLENDPDVVRLYDNIA
jgi:transcriptional/translational regulatory protein YebC/TACO1